MGFEDSVSSRLERARLSLTGLAVGDCFGGTFFWKADVKDRIRERRLPEGEWRWSDDTAMGRCVFECLKAHQTIDPDILAQLFAQEYLREPIRGYGTMAHTVLSDIGAGVPWQQAAGEVFDGMGSYGNGAAMRVGPVAAYFADDIECALEQARNSAIVTHAHLEGQAGAVAVAAAAVWASRESSFDGAAMLKFAWSHTPDGETRSRLETAMGFPLERSPTEAAALLGSGDDITSQDTVPYSLWCAARHLHSYPDALWATVEGLGDLDTTCAIVGGIVALSAPQGVPGEWMERSEPW